MAGFVRGQLGGWLWGGWLLAVGWGVFVESDHGEHFAGFFAGFGVDEEVLHEDLWSGGVRGAVLVVVIFFDVVLFAECFEGLDDLDCLWEQLLAFKENLHKTANTIIDIVHCTPGGCRLPKGKEQRR